MNVSSSVAYQLRSIRPYVSSAQSVELFPNSVLRAFDRIEAISKDHQDAPSSETLAWAKKVLLRVLPRHYLQGAEIDSFEREIHVNWEHGSKRVTVFLPAPDQLKIYCENVTDHGIEHHLFPNANDPWAVSGALGWLFQ